MKRLLTLLCATLLIQTFGCYSEMLIGSLTQEIETTTSITRKRLRFAADEKDYINGGITFNYPTGCFSVPPTVRITIETKIGYSSTELMSPCITSNNATQTTVRVNKGTTASISEASTDDVCVHIFAVGP